jgi:hypothetical protein
MTTWVCYLSLLSAIKKKSGVGHREFSEIYSASTLVAFRKRKLIFRQRTQIAEILSPIFGYGGRDNRF